MATDKIVKKNEFAVDTISIGSVTVPANSYADQSFTVTKSGYTPVGVILFSVSGTGTLYMGTASFNSAGTTCSMRILNYYSESKTGTCAATILYKKS